MGQKTCIPVCKAATSILIDAIMMTLSSITTAHPEPVSRGEQGELARLVEVEGLPVKPGNDGIRGCPSVDLKHDQG